jgi:Putative peptidoglycan binding domain
MIDLFDGPEEPVGTGPNDDTPTAMSIGAGAEAGTVTGAKAPADIDEIGRHDGRSRRRQAVLVVGVAALAGLTGVLVGRTVKSPADEAASRAAPTASRITVPVERQRLESNLVLAGEVQFNEPVEIKLAGAVGVPSGEAQVITRLPAVDQAVQEGDVPFEVSGRPVLFLQGALPMYRRLAIGTQGPDVQQLEESLARLGFAPGTIDTVFDQATADAVTAMYADDGYVPEGPTDEQRDQLRTARDALTAAETQLTEATATLGEQAGTVTGSQLLQLRQAVETARAAVPVAQQTAANDNTAAQSAINAARTERDSAVIIRDAALVVRNAADRPGAIDPETGEAYTSERRATLTSEAAQAEQALATAEVTLTTAVNQQPIILANGETAVISAQNSLVLAEAQLREATAPPDTSLRRQAVATATAGRDQARADLATLEATAGLRIAPGEIVFLPILPSNVTQVAATLGGPATNALATVATSETLVTAAVSRADSPLVEVGAAVTIELRDVSLEVPGTVLSVGAPPAEAAGSTGGAAGSEGGGGGGGSGAGSGGGSGRLQVVIAPTDPSALNDYVFFGAKIRIAVASTEDEVLVVPVSALSVGPDGASRVEVETREVTADDQGETTVVEVEVGLSAQGLTEIRPVDGGLAEGDRVVVGVETNERRNTDEAPSD